MSNVAPCIFPENCFQGKPPEKIIHKQDEKLPASHTVRFRMTANNSTIYLETIEEYPLEEDEELLITLSDDTPVRNPNE